MTMEELSSPKRWQLWNDVHGVISQNPLIFIDHNFHVHRKNVTGPTVSNSVNKATRFSEFSMNVMLVQWRHYSMCVQQQQVGWPQKSNESKIWYTWEKIYVKVLFCPMLPISKTFISLFEWYPFLRAYPSDNNKMTMGMEQWGKILPEVLHGLTQARNPASAARGLRLTTRAMARPVYGTLQLFSFLFPTVGLLGNT